MTGSGSGPLGLLLMIAPLAAIPVFAIVGVPQFAPVSASQSDDDGAIEWNEPATRMPPAQTESLSKGRNADDLFAPVANPSSKPDAAELRTGRGSSPAMIGSQPAKSNVWLPPPEALDQWEVRPDTPAQSSAASGKLRSRQKAAKTSTARTDRTSALDSAGDADDDGLVSAEGFDPELLKPDRMAKPSRNARPAEEAPTTKLTDKRTKELPNRGIQLPPDRDTGSEAFGQAMEGQAGWQAAARRLKELGIRKYRLESQIEEQTFVFVCNFSSPDNPRVVRRFEAGADTPLEAVQLVLQQIDEWRDRDGQGDDREPSADDDR